MKDINQVPGNAPQEAPAPFEIIIRTTDPEYLACGGEPECSAKCSGYFLLTRHGTKSTVQAQGDQDVCGVLRGLIDSFGIDRVSQAMAAARLSAFK